MARRTAVPVGGIAGTKELLAGHGRRSPTCKPVTALVPSSVLSGSSPPAGRCHRCRLALDAAAVVRVQLHDLSVDRLAAEARREHLMDATRPLVREGHRLGLGPTELAQLTGLSRQAIYDLIKDEENE